MSWTLSDEVLHLCVEKGVGDGVLFALYKMGGNVNSVRLDRTPLQLAAENGDAVMVRLLIKHGAELNAWTDIGVTALCLAAENGHEAIVRFLVERGADVTSGDEDVFEETDPFFAAAANGHTAIVEFFLTDHGASVDVRESELGRTALAVASWNGHASVVKLLIDHGSDVNVL